LRLRLIAIAVAMLAAAPASADVTARYVMGAAPGGTPLMTIEVNDRGDSRVTIGNQSAVISLDGVSYQVLSDLQGVYVAREEDIVAVAIERARAMMGPEFHPPAPRPHGSVAEAPPLTVVQVGTETVAGRTGTVWELREARARPGAHGFVWVINSDPDLAPIGRLLANQNRASMEGMQQLMGGQAVDATGFLSGINAILARGTLIRMGSFLRLDSVNHDPNPPGDFVLPSPPLTREQLAARMLGAAAH
jgi:hypothetical protein